MKILSTNLPKYIHSVDNKLYGGRAISCPYRLYTMRKNGINQIIDLRNAFSVTKYMEKLFCKMLGIRYINKNYPHRLNHLPDEEFFKEICNIINGNTETTYMHCQYGKRRTSIAAAYYEKNNTDKSPQNILADLISHGYSDIKPTSKKGKKYQKILSEFIDTYLPESK